MSVNRIIAGCLLCGFYIYLLAVINVRLTVPHAPTRTPTPVHVYPSPYEYDDPYYQQDSLYFFPV